MDHRVAVLLVLVASACGGDDGPRRVTIYDVRQWDIADGTAVEIRDVVVTAAADGAVYVQEQAGGPYSGLRVEGDAERGDLVTIEGVVGIRGQLGARRVTVTGAVAVPVPAELDTGAEGLDAWDDVLVRFEDLDTSDDGPVVLDPELTDLSGIEPGACFPSVTGILDGGKLLPRDEDDLVAGVCARSVVQVQRGSAEGPDAGRFEVGDEVRFEGLLVLAKNHDGTSLWAADVAGGEWSGIFIYKPIGTLTSIAAGDVIEVEGAVSENLPLGGTSTLTRIGAGSVEKVGEPAEVPGPAAALTTDEANAPATAEPWEGSLVEVTMVGIDDPNPGSGAFTVKSMDAVEPLIIDDFIYEGLPTPAPATCYAAIRGILHYDVGGWQLLPRDAGDLLEGCD